MTGTSRTFFPVEILKSMTAEQQAEFLRLSTEAEAPCAICERVILVGGCPSMHPDCPGFAGHKP